MHAVCMGRCSRNEPFVKHQHERDTVTSDRPTCGGVADRASGRAGCDGWLGAAVGCAGSEATICGICGRRCHRRSEDFLRPPPRSVLARRLGLLPPCRLRTIAWIVHAAATIFSCFCQIPANAPVSDRFSSCSIFTGLTFNATSLPSTLAVAPSCTAFLTPSAESNVTSAQFLYTGRTLKLPVDPRRWEPSFLRRIVTPKILPLHSQAICQQKA